MCAVWAPLRRVNECKAMFDSCPLYTQEPGGGRLKEKRASTARSFLARVGYVGRHTGNLYRSALLEGVGPPRINRTSKPIAVFPSPEPSESRLIFSMCS